jgi:hypothetical protein
MSWQIPTQIEQDIIAGKAKYQTFQTGNGGQSILPVPPNSYAVIFGYDFSPAGGGFFKMDEEGLNGASIVSGTILPFETQQIAFYTGQDFFPFLHHVDINITWAPRTIDVTNPVDNKVTSYRTIATVDNTPITRQVYITALNDMTITHGLVINATRATGNAIPITNRTPQALSYGGSPQVINTQTNYGPAATPLQFMQPSPKDFADFAFGLLPGNADNQAFATPDVTNGLIDSTQFITSNLGAAFRDIAASNYFLCLHYALYSKTVPEQRG